MVPSKLLLAVAIVSIFIPTVDDPEPNLSAQSLPLWLVFTERRDNLDLKERMIDSADQPANSGRSEGRQIAIIPTPSSTMPQNSYSDTTPMSSVAGSPATVVFFSTGGVFVSPWSLVLLVMIVYSREGAKISMMITILVTPHVIALL